MHQRSPEAAGDRLAARQHPMQLLWRYVHERRQNAPGRTQVGCVLGLDGRAWEGSGLLPRLPRVQMPREALMNGDDLRNFLDGLSLSEEARDIIWSAYLERGTSEYARGRFDGYQRGYRDAEEIDAMDWP